MGVVGTNGWLHAIRVSRESWEPNVGANVYSPGDVPDDSLRGCFMGSLATRTSSVLTLLTAVSIGAGSASSTLNNVPDRAPVWTKVYVAGSSSTRQADRQGKPDTGQYVISISDRQLIQMPGFTLGDKLAGASGSGF